MIGTALLAAAVWVADANAGAIDEVPPFPPFSGTPGLGEPPVCANVPRTVPASVDASTLRAYSRCAQDLAAASCRSGADTGIADQLAARFSLPGFRVTKALRRINSAHLSGKGWCDLTVDDYAAVVRYAAGGRDGVAEHREEWIRFTIGDENGHIAPGGLARALDERRALVREPVRERVATAPDLQTIGALPPSPAGWTSLTGYVHPVGRINDLLIHPASTSTMWAGADGGGIWKTTDGGASWQAVNDFLGSLSIASFAMRAGDPGTIYAATGAQGSHGGAIGAGVFKSVDGGTNWSPIASTDPATNPDWQRAYKLAIHPGDSNTLLAATQGGAYSTTDGGSSWTRLFAGEARSVAIHPANGNLRVIAMDDGTIRVTTDGSTYNNYTIVSVAPPAYTRIALAPSSQNVMYALVNSGGNTRLYRSATGGSTWSPVTPPANFFYDYFFLSYTGGLWVDPTNANRIAVVEGWGMVTADASAATPVWKQLCCGWVDFHAVVNDPGYNGTTNKIVYFMDDGGLYKWNDVDTVDTAAPEFLSPFGINATQVYAVAGRGGAVVFGAQDVATRYYRAAPPDDLTQKWRFAAGLGGHDGGGAAADRTNPNILYGATQFLGIHRSLDGGVTTSFICGGITDISCGGYFGNASFIAPFVLDPNNQNRMLAGAASLWRSENVSSATPAWTRIHSGLGGPTITAIAVAPSDSNVIWIAYETGQVYKTTNGAAVSPSWTQVINVPVGNKLRIYIDRTDANRVYLGLSGFLPDRLQMTPDGGATWSAVAGLPGASVFTIQQHPSIADWLYAGTVVGLFASEDGGATWSTTNDGPANVQVRDLSWYSESGSAAELLLGTFGRGVWRATLNPDAAAGAIKFQSSAYTVREGAPGGVVLSLIRSTGAAGAVSVTYNIVEGTATAGADYTGPLSGTVSWADGDASVKTISIPVVNDGVNEADETFAVVLTSATGGATLGTPAAATVTITDPELFPPQCQMPAGWFVPGTANAGWTVAADQAYEKSCSLKSAPIGNGQAAEIAFTGNFTAGNITFRRKVSSEQDYDFFKFFIDGVEQLAARASGEVDWVNPPEAISFPVIAGTHTIAFRYEKDVVCCIGGSDAAWIDAVTLPLAADTALTVNKSGNGVVTSIPAGISCGETCSALFVQGTLVTLIATPDAGYEFSGWSGACSGTGGCTIVMDAPATVTATFSPSADTQAPSVPAGLTATAGSASQINLAWNASTDNVGVTAYQVFRTGVFRATVNAPTTSFSDTGLAASTSYSYTVAACDAAGNCSAQSASASATTQAEGSLSFMANLEPGFNLVGNSLNITLDVAAIFGNQDAPTAITSNIVSIWKWNAADGRWAFYSPQLMVAGNAAFAAARGYEVLSTINPGEGYWVNAISAMTLPTQTGTGFNWTGINFPGLPSGFNLIAHASNAMPSQFNIDVSATAPSPGTVPTENFVSLWAWDALRGKWYFYSPLLEASGGLPAVKSYADSHFYLHFEDYNKQIEIGVGFWVNRP